MLDIGDIIFVRGHLHNPLDDAIKLYETFEDKQPFASCYTHCAIYMGDGVIAEAQGGRVTGWANLTEYDGNYDIGHLKTGDETRQRIKSRAILDFGKPYDWGLIADLGLSLVSGQEIPYNERESRICSTYINSVMKDCGVFLCPNKENPSPEDLALSHMVTIERVS